MNTYSVWKIILLFLFVFTGVLIGQFFVAMPIIMLVFGETIQSLSSLTSSPETLEHGRAYLFLLQGIGQVVGMLVAPYIFQRFVDREEIIFFPQQQNVQVQAMFVAIGILVSFWIPLGQLIAWNEHITFPESWRVIEKALRQMEDSAKQLTDYLTQFNSVGQLLVAILVIAIIPGISEEYVFRGLIQNRVQRITKNYHTAIWITAFLFSAFHFQFYGFVPRMCLGALLGYLYVWSGNIAVPMFLHFLHNGMQCVMLYVAQQQGIDKQQMEDYTFPPMLVMLFSCIFVFLLYVFYRYYYTRRTA